MKTHLLHPSRDFLSNPVLLPHEKDLKQDLELPTLFEAMAGGDRFLYEVAQQTILSPPQQDFQTVLFRQHVLKDCLANRALVKQIYEIAVDAIEQQQRSWFGIFSRYPGSILHGALNLLGLYMTALRKLRALADEHSGKFHSNGFTVFFATLQAELPDAYFEEVSRHLEELEFDHGLLISAQLGQGNGGINYTLREPPERQAWWIEWFMPNKTPGFSFRISERDEAGARALGELRDRGINQVANATGQAADHIKDFLIMLRKELAFYLACGNLHERLRQFGMPVCFPVPETSPNKGVSATNLQDACLALSMKRAVVGNDLETRDKNLVVVTGANQGGKSTFLRSVGLAQLMMECGMFVPAESYRAALCSNLLTHYKREEDSEMNHGKFDEELSRMNSLVEGIKADSLVLFNESFAATNEREGSEIAHQIVRALLEAGVRVFFVTHFYEFARVMCEEDAEGVLFLRADRNEDGGRTFKVRPGEPLATSYGQDIYRKIFVGSSLSGP